MPQLSALPINIPQGVEIMDENPLITSTSSGEDFSQLIDQHMATSQGCAYREKTNTSQQPVENKGPVQDEDTVGPKVRVEEMNSGLNGSDAKQQDIAASGKNVQINEGNIVENSAGDKAILASDQLMSFFQKADSALQKTSLNAEPFAGLADDEKALYEQSILLSHNKIVEGTASSAQFLSGLQVEKSVAQTSQQLVTNEKLALSSLSERENIDKGISQLPVEAVNKAELAIGGITGNDIEKSELLSAKNLSTTQTAPKTVASMSTTNPSEQAVNSLLATSDVETSGEGELSLSESVDEGLMQQKLSTKVVTQEKQLTDSNHTQAVSGEDKLTAKIKAEQLEQVGAAQAVKDAKHDALQGVASNAATQFKQSISAFEKKVSELAQAKNASSSSKNAVESIQATEQLVSPEQATPNQTVTNQADVTSKMAEQFNATNIGQNANKPITSLGSTQVGQTQINTEQASQAQKVEQQQLSSIEGLVEESKEEEMSLPKGKSELGEKFEDKSTQQNKNSLSANASFTDVSARSTQLASQTLEQQTIEQLSPAVTSEVAQSQKTNAQLHQETISIFRKDFSDAVKDKVMLMISQKLQQFDIKLDPPELGNMQVRVNLQSEQAAVNFVVQNQQAKEALEQNMHKLRDMLAQQGVDVGDANVEQQSQQSGSDEFSNSSPSEQMEETASANDVVEHSLSAQVINASANAVDYYA